MDKEIITFDDTEIEKYKFYQYKISILINDIGINEIEYLISFPLITRF